MNGSLHSSCKLYSIFVLILYLCQQIRDEYTRNF